MSGLNPARANHLLRKRGFTLVVVLWGVGLIAFLILGFTVSTRLRVQTTSNLLEHAKAAVLAKAAVNIGILSQANIISLNGAANSLHSTSGKPFFCSLPQNALAAIYVEDESGKIDLNGANPDLLYALFRGLNIDQSRADILTKAVLTFRSAPTNALQQPQTEGSVKPKEALFQTKFELDQIAGMDDALYQRLLPFVTVYSPRNGINPKVASPDLVARLNRSTSIVPGTPEARSQSNDTAQIPFQLPPEFIAVGEPSSAFTIHAEAILPNSVVATQEVNVLFRAAEAQQEMPSYAIKEWYLAKQRYRETLEAAVNSHASWPNCQEF